MTLFSRQGAAPVDLPFADQDANGDTWTNLADNPAGRTACGWAEAPAPAFDGAIERLAWTDGAWAVMAIPAEEIADAREQLRAARIAELAAIRYQRQQTFEWQSKSAPADDATIARVAALVQLQTLNGAAATDIVARWKFEPCVLTPVTLADMIAYGSGMAAHMQACFDRENVIAAELLAATGAAAIGAVDLQAGWPS